MNFRQIVNLFFSCLYIVFVGLTSVLFFCVSCLIWLITVKFDRRRVALNMFASFWASFYIWCMPLWAVRIKGREKLNWNESYVMVSNHQSQLDILLLYRLFFPMRWISKAEVFKLPFIGWNMVLNGYVKLKRGDKESISQMMDDCESLLARNISIMIFPEGTRSRSGQLKTFKPGAFILAKKMKKPILPLVINNSKDALPKHTFRFHGYHEMEIRILDEIPYQEFSDLDVADITQMVRQRIAAHVNEHVADEKEKPVEYAD